ncbi:Magnesium transporter NIPA [Streptomyces sp. TverLS-915]|uniref:DMT family transporter n=1 Tax=unclassified Streptomyces TaxID=2593676 RepID=UPI00081D7356|nr:DMT family transporter [Streptomyces sp. TverLS-915]SCD38135.1 Magnesium transporter NIPA [Streptomyces sp. TverLS-915]
MSDVPLSVLFALVSAVAYAAGAIVQERVAVRQGPEGYAPWRRPAWWGAVALNGLGALLHVGALAFGPLSLVQPLGALTIVFALPMAALLVRQRASAAAWRGALLAAAGLAGLLALTGSGGERVPGGQALGVLGLVTLGTVLALLLVARGVHHHPAARGGFVAAAAGVAFGMASVYTKTVTDRIAHESPLEMLPLLGAVSVLACAGMLLSQASYRGAGLTAPLATQTVVNPVTAAAVGFALFGEHMRFGVLGEAGAAVAGAIAAVGLVWLTVGRTAPPPAPEPPAAVTESSPSGV